jgi:hypothetical protein
MVNNSIHIIKTNNYLSPHMNADTGTKLVLNGYLCLVTTCQYSVLGKYAFNQKDIFKYHYSLSCLFVVVALATTHAAIKRKTKILITGDNVISDTTCRTQYSCDGLRRYTDMLWLDTNIHSIQVLCQYLHSYEVRGNCSFWWYVWNCRPSLFRLTFHNIQNLLSQWLDDFHTVINRKLKMGNMNSLKRELLMYSGMVGSSSPEY